MFFSVENESSRKDIFTLQQTLKKHWSSDKLCVNWFTSQKVWSCLHPLTQILFSLELLGRHSKKWPTSAAQNSQAAPTRHLLWQLYDMADMRAVTSCWAIRSTDWLGETGANLQHRLIVPFASTAPWWHGGSGQDRACSPASPQLCRMWPGMLVGFGGHCFCKQFLRSFLSQVNSKNWSVR